MTITSGEITRPNASYFAVATEGGASTDDLVSILGEVIEGEQIILRVALSMNTVVLRDQIGKLRLTGDFSLTHSQDRICLQFDGTNGVEL